MVLSGFIGYSHGEYYFLEIIHRTVVRKRINLCC